MLKMYSLGCPKCLVLEKLLDKKSIKYEKITDVDTVKKFGEEHKKFSVPLLEVIDEDNPESESIILDFNTAVRYINTLKIGE